MAEASQAYQMAQRDYRFYRWLEILPGAAVWATLILAFVISFVRPLWAIVFILLFDVYWLIRVLYVMIYVILAWSRYRQVVEVNWLARLQKNPSWSGIFHVVIIPTFREPASVLEGTISSLTHIQYPLEKLLIVLATEQRDAGVGPIAADLVKRYQGRFGAFIVTTHPDGIPGELASKGANISWAGRQVQALLSERHIPDDQVVVSTFDADSVAHPQYFAYLTETFLSHPRRLHSSYQPIPVFHNNVWSSLFLMRVVANSTTFWMLSEAQRPDRLFTFSSHSMPWRALVDVGFWQTDVVNEDSRIFLQCFLHYDGDYTVTPLYLPISMDAVQAPTWWRNFVNQYKQIQRWAYGGVENFPFSVWNFLHDRRLPGWVKWRYTWMQWEGIFSWATAPVLILVLGWLPFLVASDSLKQMAIIHNAPSSIQGLMTLAMIGLIVSAVLGTIMLPKRPSREPWYRWVMMVGQWLFLPVTMILFGSVPAIDAQTRMMLGRYLGFIVTEKTRLAPGSRTVVNR